MKTYLDKDVRDLLQIKDMMQFHTFIRLCAGRIGSLFKASELANEIGVSSHTVTAWLSVLQASYIVFLLPPYFENTRKRLTKTPKLYFTDTGACLSPARHRIAGTACTGQDAWGVVRELHRNGSLEAAV